LAIGGCCVAAAAHMARRNGHRLKHKATTPSVRVTLTADAGRIRIIRCRASHISRNRDADNAMKRGGAGGDRVMTDVDRLSLKALMPANAVSACAGAAVRRDHLGAAPASIDWTAVTAAVGSRIEEMLDIPLLGAFLDAWKDYQDFADGADLNKTLPLPLIDYALDASFDPHLEIAVSGVPTARVGFEIGAEIEFEGIELVIEHRAIRALRLGSCRAVVTVKCEGIVVCEHSSPKLELRGEIRVPGEIPLGSSRVTTAAEDGWI
jgi:hypothetical protein